MIEVVAINRAQRLTLLNDGRTIPFASVHDEEGDETTDPQAESYATAQLPDGRWIAIIFSEFETESVQ